MSRTSRTTSFLLGIDHFTPRVMPLMAGVAYGAKGKTNPQYSAPAKLNESPDAIPGLRHAEVADQFVSLESQLTKATATKRQRVIDPDLSRKGYLRLAEVLRLIPVSRSSFYAGMAEGIYPQSVLIGKRAVAWRVEDIEQLLDSLK